MVSSIRSNQRAAFQRIGEFSVVLFRESGCKEWEDWYGSETETLPLPFTPNQQIAWLRSKMNHARITPLPPVSLLPLPISLNQ